MLLFPSFQEQSTCSSSAAMNIKLYIYGWSQTSSEDAGDSIIMFSASTLPKWVLLIGSSSTSGSTTLMGSSRFLFIHLKFSFGSSGSAAAVWVWLWTFSLPPCSSVPATFHQYLFHTFGTECDSSFGGWENSLKSCLLPVFMMSFPRSKSCRRLDEAVLKSCIRALKQRRRHDQQSPKIQPNFSTFT